MRGRRRRPSRIRYARGLAGTLAALLALALALGASGCGGDEDRPAPVGAAATGGGLAVKVVRRSPDSDAPATAPAHWLPPEPWVYNHWLPYDEARLERVLGISREQLWEQLRDDRRTLAQLAARRGHPDPRALAALLVRPRAAAVGPARARELRRRALQTITQGHLAQHVFFHSLHQFAIPSAAPDIFGVSDAAFRGLRRQELSPLAIGRLRGRSPGSIQGAAIAVLRERAQAGTREGAISRAQAALLLRRQLTQLPRWLDQARYNGPPVTHRGDLTAKPQDYASNPAISSDGRYVAYEAYRQKLALAVKLGEIAVLRADLRTGATMLVSAIPGRDATRPNPVSAYNPAISGDGRHVSFESSAGNQNFAKRYGRIGTLLADARTGRAVAVGRPDRRSPDSQSSYNPDVAAGGARMIYQAVRGGRTVVRLKDLRTGRERTVVAGARAGGPRYADPYEATLSAAGTRVVHTLAEGTVGRPSSARSSVRVRDLRTGRTLVASPPGHGFSADGAVSPDGGHVAFTSTAPRLGVGPGRVGLFVRDLRRGRTRRIPTGGDRPLDPVVARDGRTVAFTAVRGQTAQVLAWSAATGTSVLVSRRGVRGAGGDGFSGDPSIAADGRRVAFASTATNLVRDGDGARAIYVRDLRAGRTRRVSAPAVAYAGRTLKAPPKPARASEPPRAVPTTAAAVDDPDTVIVTDNAFVDDGERPQVRVSAGTRVTWRWRSRQSHAVLTARGPERFASIVRQQGAFRHRFTRPGAYEIVCSLHAPGMRMRVLVEPD